MEEDGNARGEANTNSAISGTNKTDLIDAVTSRWSTYRWNTVGMLPLEAAIRRRQLFEIGLSDLSI